MQRFSILALLWMTALTVSACGAGNAVPTATAVDPVALQSTMMAAAAQMVLETQAAIPTSTPVPTATPTNTPVPTATFLPPGTLEAALTLNPGGNGNAPGAGDPCIYQTLPAPMTGDKIKIRIDNPLRSTLMVSVNLNQSGPQSLCGYRSYSLAARESLVINDMVAGCYTVWAWNPDPQDYFIVTSGTTCLDTSTTWTFDISTTSIKLR